MNAYWMLQDIRDSIDESSSGHWDDVDILRKLNQSYRMRAMELMMSFGDWLVKKSSALTAVNSVITLPSDCAKPVSVEEVSTERVIPIQGTVRERRATRVSGTSLYSGILECYMLGNTLEVNQDGYGEQVYVWYVQRVPDLHTGAADTGSGASSLVFDLDTAPNRSDDYYNNQTVEVVDGTGSGIISTISDYDGAAYTATIVGTAAVGDNYGTVSALPEEADPYIVADAVLRCLTKPSSAIDPRYFEYAAEVARQTKRLWDDWRSSRHVGSNRVRITEIE